MRLKSFQELRETHGSKTIFKHFLGTKKKQESLKRKYLLGDDCLLLQFASWAMTTNNQAEFLKTTNPLATPLRLKKGLTQLIADLHIDCRTPLEAKLKLLRLLLETVHDVPEIEAAIQEFVQLVNCNWQYQAHSKVQERMSRVSFEQDRYSGTRFEPSFMKFLPSDDWRTAFRNVAQGLYESWMHPGLLLAGETVAIVRGDADRSKMSASTHVMFAYNHLERPQGILAKLIVERLPGGCGVLIPDPRCTCSLHMDREFSNGLQHAWLAVQDHFDASLCNFDWRWSLHLERATRDIVGRPLTIPIEGNSAEVAIACALWGVHSANSDAATGEDPLDPATLVTAALQQPGSESDLLKPVGQVDIKTLLPGKFRKRRVQRVIVHRAHDGSELPAKSEGFEFPKATSLTEAYQLLSRYSRMTQIVRTGLYQAATELRNDLCGEEVADWREAGRNYVPSPMVEVLHTKMRRQQPHEKPEERELTRKELKQLAYGLWDSRRRDAPAREKHAPRIRIFADSGMGKSIFMLICEQKVSGGSRPLIPIRIGKTAQFSETLDSINWANSSEDILSLLLDIRLEEHFPKELKPYAKDWLVSQVRLGNVILLFDALDQNARKLSGMGNFFKSELMRHCPVIVTGRPESRFGNKEAFAGIPDVEWLDLKVMPFQEAQQERFLGSKLAGDIVPEEDTLNAWSGSQEIRKHQLWKELLGVPLLLRMIKDLALGPGREATSHLSAIRNRYELYDLAIKEMIRKGNEAIGDTDLSPMSQAELEDLLGPIAWASVCEHNFTGVISGRTFQDVLQKCGIQTEKIREKLKQMNLVTVGELIDSYGSTGMEWRHRSFMEYYAGLWMTKTVKGKLQYEIMQDKEDRDLIYDIHNVLEGDKLRTWSVKTENGVQHLFRDLPADWHWTLRFALCHAAKTSDLALDNVSAPQNRLALELIRRGNPWIVYEAIDRDGLAGRFSPPVENLARWLVHRRADLDRNYRNAWQGNMDSTAILSNLFDSHGEKNEAEWPQFFSDILDRSTRDAGYLDPWLELLESGQQGESAVSAACQQALQAYAAEAQQRKSQFASYLESFQQIPKGEFDPWKLVYEYRRVELENAGLEADQPLNIEAFELADFPTTNFVFESWCPTQRRRRDQYSFFDDSPVVYVNWYMSRRFADYLSRIDTSYQYRLPSEWEWEYGCRAGEESFYWWGPEMRDDLCWYNETSKMTGTRSRSAAIAAVKAAGSEPRKHPYGLLDLHGNVWEICEDAYRGTPSGIRSSSRGGSWDFSGWYCRVTSRRQDELLGSVNRYVHIGFRLSRTSSGP